MTAPFLDSMARISKLYSNQGLHKNAQFIADLHPRAIEYLEQAPVLALAFGVRRNTNTDRLWVASNIGGAIIRGEKLRVVMDRAMLPYPLRKLRGTALSPYSWEFIRETAHINPSTLSQVIPDKVGKQREWLRSLHDWQMRMKMRHASPRTGFAWIIMNAQHCAKGEASDFADFVFANPGTVIDRWTYERMTTEVSLWHDRLATNRSLKEYGMGITPTTVIDLSDWPDHTVVGDYEFFKLSTPAMLIEEGARMRHCVASYIPDVMSGQSHIFSIRQNMRRMATLQVRGPAIAQMKAFANKQPLKVVEAAAWLFVSTACPERKAA